MIYSQLNKKSSTTRWCSAFLMLAIVAGAAVIILLYGSTIWERLGAGGELPPFFSWDETDDSSQEDFKSWRANGKGLKLTVVNAMTSDWYQYFDEAVADWNAAPALSLTVEMAKEPDPDCMYIIGKLKACNDDYGMTGWSGLNEAWLDSRGTITASTAKMNESYLRGKQYAEKLYVTCHELGHGYGLPHRDTNANNIDLGTCLDYTTMYRNNMRPDEIDFMNLETLYGTIGGKKRHLTLDHNPSLRRKDNYIHGSHSFPKEPRRLDSYKNGRLLFKSNHKEIYEEAFGDGSKVVTTLLLAQ